MVMEKSWTMKNVLSHGVLTIFPPNCAKLVFFGHHQEINYNLESLHFQKFSAKRRECKIGKKDCHGKSRNRHGKVMEKYVVKSVGTLHLVSYIN